MVTVAQAIFLELGQSMLLDLKLRSDPWSLLLEWTFSRYCFTCIIILKINKEAGTYSLVML